MSNNRPNDMQHWRNVNAGAVLAALCGGALVLLALRSRPISAPAPSADDLCTMDGQTFPCGILPENGVGMSGVERTSRSNPNGASAFALMLGLPLFLGGIGVGIYAGTRLRTLERQAIDYAHEQLQTSKACASCQTLNAGHQRFCGGCGERLSP